MSEESRSPSGENKPQPVFFQSVKYGVAVIAGTWGLVQIILYIDPFFLIQFQFANKVGLWLLVFMFFIFVPAMLARFLNWSPSNRFDQAILQLDKLLRRHVPLPVFIALIIFALFLIVLGSGRVFSVSETDIAKEELRSLGMQFSMASLQNALYFYDDRTVNLFRRAGVRTGDIYRALGQPHEFTGQDPLLLGIFARLNEERSKDDALSLAERLVNLLKEEQREEKAPLSHPFLLHGSESEGGKRSLLSYALENQGGYVAKVLLDQWVPLPGTLPDESMSEEPYRALTIGEDHAAVLIDPWLALARSENGRLSPRERVALETALCNRGVRPLASIRKKLNSDSRSDESVCKSEPEPVPDNVPALLKSDVLKGIVVRPDDDGGCSVVVVPVDFSETDASFSAAPVPSSENDASVTQPIVISREGRLDEPEKMDVILQYMKDGEGDYYRLALSAEMLSVTGWNPITGETVPLPALFPARSVFLSRNNPAQSDQESPLVIWGDGSEGTPLEGVRLDWKENELIDGRLLKIDRRTGVELQVDPPAVNLCLRVLRSSDDTETGSVLASRFVNAEEATKLQVPFVGKDERIRVEVALAEPDDTDVSLIVTARNILNCASGEKPSSLRLGLPWEQGLKHEGSLASGDKLRCIVHDDYARRVSIRLSGMSGDLDLELRSLDPASLEEPPPIKSSDNFGVEDEVIEKELDAGLYAIDVLSFAEGDSPFTLTIEQSEQLRDEGAGPERDSALVLGTLSPGDPPRVETGFLQMGRKEEFFAVDLSALTQLDVHLSDSSADLNLEVQNNEGQKIAPLTEMGAEDEQFSVPVYGGRYYIRVYRSGDGGFSRYRLKLEARELEFPGGIPRP